MFSLCWSNFLHVVFYNTLCSLNNLVHSCTSRCTSWISYYLEFNLIFHQPHKPIYPVTIRGSTGATPPKFLLPQFDLDVILISWWACNLCVRVRVCVWVLRRECGVGRTTPTRGHRSISPEPAPSEGPGANARFGFRSASSPTRNISVFPPRLCARRCEHTPAFIELLICAKIIFLRDVKIVPGVSGRGVHEGTPVFLCLGKSCGLCLI